ncbi:DUF445 domain-containing protein [Neomoorella thermoacetica]|uniref:Uncharacterized protein conserved in bacteria n=1 Tax=Moorella thermoacetica Y72 TaxID=1325331 RepID=A0A0S6UBX5_NEOTH|nr:DUF445 family protein [Moorella thermoacetica]APC08959.1 hypothetical protein MTJW_18000 [Moorella thermoacetica]GAF24902.1 uncharacterized protein conserved in bacteria [Moorella thermoacetica Y72]
MYIYGRWIVIPLIGAFIGWITNVLAIRLLFRPHRPFQFLFWTFQGLIPKRRAEIAANVARVVDKDLLPLGEVLEHLRTPALEEKITELVVEVARRRLTERLPSFIPAGLKEAASKTIEETLRREIPPALEELEGELTSSISSFSLGDLVAEKINKLDLHQVENLIVEVAGRELRYIELLGGVLGFFIGLVQAFVAGR